MSFVVDTRAAAVYIGMSESWLRQGRMMGRIHGRTAPPPYIRIGRAVRYATADLDRWLEANRIDPSGSTDS